MKSTKFLALMVTGLFLTASLMAQPPVRQFKGMQQAGHPAFGKGKVQLQLTEKQQAQMAKLRLSFEKEMLPLRDQVRSMQTQYRLLVINPKVNKTELRAQLNKISALRQKMALKRAEQQRKIRSLLTEKQKIIFDQRFLAGPGKRNMGKRGGMRGHHGQHRMMR